MQSTPIRTNLNRITLSNGTIIIVSYQTPVAATVKGVDYKTEQKFSNTTTRHINEAGYKNAELKPQSFFDDLLAAA